MSTKIVLYSTDPYIAKFGGGGDPNGVKITAQPQDWMGPIGNDATFTVTATSGDASPLIYQWEEFTGTWNNVVDGGRISGATTATLTITATVYEDRDRMFRVVVSNDTNSVTSRAPKLITDYVAPTVFAGGSYDSVDLAPVIIYGDVTPGSDPSPAEAWSLYFGNLGTDPGLTGTFSTPPPAPVFSSIDPANKAAIMILSENNLRCVSNSAGTRGVAFATQGVTTGKWYWEAYSLTAVSAQGIGIGQAGTNMTSFLGNGAGDWGYFPSGAYWTNNTNTGTGTAYTTGSILGFALDMAGNLDVYVDGVLSFSVAHGLTGLTWPGITDASTGAICDWMMNFGSDSSFGGRTTAQENPDHSGAGDFYYAPPAGFLSLNNAPPIFYDNFVDADQTLLINHVPDNGPQAYQFAVDTSPKIVGNKVTSSIAGRQICGYDIGQVNKRVSFNIEAPGSLVVFRLRVDMNAVDQNHVYFYRTSTVVQIVRLQAGGATTLATANVAHVAGEQVVITDDGNTITVTVGGETITADTTFLNTLTTMGLQVNGVGASIDNLVIEDLYVTEFTPDQFGRYVLELTATPGDGPAVSDFAQITSAAAGVTAPLVNAGGSYPNAVLYQPQQLAGTVTPGTDPAPTYLWTVTPLSPQDGVFSDATSLTSTFTPNSPGVYNLILTATTTDSIPVDSLAPLTSTAIAPTVDAGGPYEAVALDPVAIDGTVTPGTDVSPTTLWTIVSGGAGTFDDPTAVDTNFNPGVDGPYTLRLTATPDDGPAVSADATYTVGSGLPAWAAASSEYMVTGAGSHEFVAQLAGVGTPTFDTPADLLLPDYEGVYHPIPEDTMPVYGSRVVTNYCYSSADPTQTWDTTNCTDTFGSPDPDGGNTATRVLTIGAGATQYTDLYANGSQSSNPVFSVWLKSNTGSNQTLRIQAAQLSPDVTVTNEWQRFTITSSSLSATRGGIFSDVAENPIDVLLWHPQYEWNANVTVPSEYVETASFSVTPVNKYFTNLNGNTVTSNVVTEAEGAPLTTMPSLYAAPAMTNVQPYSNDMSQTSYWTGGTGLTRALDEVGLTGQPNTASTVGDEGVADLATCQNLPNRPVIPNDSNPITFVHRVKKRTSAPFPELQHQLLGGTNVNGYIGIDLTTGATNNRLTSTGLEVESVDDGDWWIFYVKMVNNSSGNTTVKVQLVPARSTTINGSDDATLTGEIIVGNIEIHSGKTIAQVKGAAPIVTAAASVTNTEVLLKYDLGNFDSTNGCYYVENIPLSTPDDSGDTLFITAGSKADVLGWSTTTQIRAQDNTGLATVTMPSLSANVELKASCAYGDATKVVNANGVYGSEVGYTGWNTPTFPEIRVCVRNVGGVNPPYLSQTIRNIQNWVLPYTEAKAKIDELLT